MHAISDFFLKVNGAPTHPVSLRADRMGGEGTPPTIFYPFVVLSEAGADPKARDINKKTPWDYANNNEDLQITEPYWYLYNRRL